MAEGLQPVGADQCARLVGMDRVAVPRHILLEALEGEVPPQSPVGVLGFRGRLRDPGLVPESLPALPAVARLDGPDITIDPEAVHLVPLDQLDQLGDHQLLEVRAPGTHLLAGLLLLVRAERRAGRFLVRASDAPCRMLLAGRGVPDPRIVAVEWQPKLARDLAPLHQRVLHNARGDRRVGHLAEPARVARVTFAVRLHELGRHELKRRREVLWPTSGTKLRIAGTRVQVVMHPEVVLVTMPSSAFWFHVSSPWCLRRSFGCHSVVKQGRSVRGDNQLSSVGQSDQGVLDRHGPFPWPCVHG